MAKSQDWFANDQHLGNTVLFHHSSHTPEKTFRPFLFLEAPKALHHVAPDSFPPTSSEEKGENSGGLLALRWGRQGTLLWANGEHGSPKKGNGGEWLRLKTEHEGPYWGRQENCKVKGRLALLTLPEFSPLLHVTSILFHSTFFF